MSQSYKMTQNITKFGVDKLLMKKNINCQVPSFEFWILMQKVRHLWRWSSDKKNIAHTCFTHKHILPFVPTKSEQQKRNKKKNNLSRQLQVCTCIDMHSRYIGQVMYSIFLLFSLCIRMYTSSLCERVHQHAHSIYHAIKR
jgi:hypothetical protein